MEHFTYSTQPATIAYLPRYRETTAIQRVKNSITPTESEAEMHVVQKLQVKNGCVSRRKTRRISVSGSGEHRLVCNQDGPQTVPNFFSRKRASMFVDAQTNTLTCITFSPDQLGLNQTTSISVDFRDLFLSETWFRYTQPQQQTQTTVFSKCSHHLFASTPNIAHYTLINSDTEDVGLLMLVTFGHYTNIPNAVESKWIFIDNFRQKITQQFFSTTTQSGFITANASDFNVTVLPKSLLVPKDDIAKHSSMYHFSENYLVYIECTGREMIVCHLKDMAIFTALLESTLNLTAIPKFSFSEFIGPQEARFRVGLENSQGRRDWVARLQLESGKLIVNPVIKPLG